MTIKNKTLFNAHHMQTAGVEVDNKMIVHGGNQRLVVDGVHIPLDSVNGDTIQLGIRLPTDDELASLPCVVLCKVCASTIQRKQSIFDRAFRHLPNWMGGSASWRTQRRTPILTINQQSAKATRSWGIRR